MSLRKEVFQAKVLQRLYPAAPKTHDVQDSPSSNGKSTKPPGGVRHQPNDGSGVSVSNAGECRLVRRRKVYTALPRPDDYRPPSADGSVTAAVTGSSGPHSPDDGRPALNPDLSGSDDHSGTEDEDPITRRRRRRRRRKRKAGVVSEPGEAGARETPPQGGATAPLPEGPEGGNKPEPHSAEGPERLSRNKKRKMKKKRHKEKLVSLGLVPRPRALEFTYTHGGEDQGVEDHAEETQQNLDEIVDEIEAFLRSTMDLCLSDRSSGVGRPSLAADVAESLFARMSDRTLPPTGLTGLCRLGALLAQRDVGKLNAALQEFSSTSTLSTAETAVVCTLFHYWITDILPVQKERNS